mmetsp:Transcript_62678/g.115250  ORF Transcript_62678/g.115250 Transcript_62678/m.115250 type:complete len:472 (-) Transcript_62678:148-1563(-)
MGVLKTSRQSGSWLPSELHIQLGSLSCGCAQGRASSIDELSLQHQGIHIPPLKLNPGPEPKPGREKAIFVKRCMSDAEYACELLGHENRSQSTTSTRESTSESLTDEQLSNTMVSAWRAGRAVEAYRELLRIEDAGSNPNEFLDEASIERIQRIGARYESSQGEIQAAAGSDWVFDHDAASGLELAFRSGDSLFQMVATAKFEREDPLRAFAALCEHDLCTGYNKEVSRVEQLGGRHDHPHDSIWRMWKQGKLGTEDNIRQLSCVDALDEPLGALWVSVYSPSPQEISTLRGVKIPPADARCRRAWNSQMTFCIKPLKAANDQSHGGFSLTVSICTKPSPVAKKLLSFTPSRLLGSKVRSEALLMMNNFGKHVATCGELDQRLTTSSRAELYASVRQRLDRDHLGHLLGNSLVPVSELTLLRQSPSKSGENYPLLDDEAQHTQCAHELDEPINSMAELAAHVPLNWADQAE